MTLSRTAKIAVALLTLPTAALADRPPTLDEREAVTGALVSAGYTSWSEIEYEEDDQTGGVWEVDDALRDGQSYDVTLDADFGILTEERD